jgi:hypothetical protein
LSVNNKALVIALPKNTLPIKLLEQVY